MLMVVQDWSNHSFLKQISMSHVSISENVQELIDLTLNGKWETAYEKFYHQDLLKVDLDGIEVNGKEQNIQLGKRFAASISNVRAFSSAGYIVEGNRSFISWSFDFDVEGNPFKVEEVAIQDWQDGKIIKERFFA